MRTKTLNALWELGLIIPTTTGCTGDAEETAPPAVAAEAQATDPAAVSQEIARRVDQYTAAWNGNDPSAVAAFFTEDARARVGEDTYTGREQILSDWLQNTVPNIHSLHRGETRREQRGPDHLVAGSYPSRPKRARVAPGSIPPLPGRRVPTGSGGSVQRK